MKIVNCGFDYRHSEDFKINRPNGSGDYILLVLRSPAFFCFNNKISHTNGNAVVLFKKGTPQIYGAHNATYINDWVHFEAEAGDAEFLDRLGIPFDEIIELQNVTELSSMIKHMCFEKYSNNKNSLQSTNLYFHLTLLKISDYCHANTTKEKSALSMRLNKLRNDIYANPQKKWSIDDIADELSYSRSYLQHQYKLFFNTSIKKDITVGRIEYGKYILFSTEYTISTVARLCGYDSEVHFMRIFKQETGVTPTQYRTDANHSRQKTIDSKQFNPFSKRS